MAGALGEKILRRVGDYSGLGVQRGLVPRTQQDKVMLRLQCSSELSNSSANPAVLHIICDRDVGLFNLILSVIPQLDWAFRERRIPIVYYGEGNCYWTPNGY